MRISLNEAVRRNWIQPEPGLEKCSHDKKRRKADTEGREQAEVIRTFRALYSEVGDLLIHVPNGGSRKGAFEGWRLKEQGVRPGVSDLLLPVARGGYFGLWIELKATPPKDSPVSEAQKEWVELMRRQGFMAEICFGSAQALEVLINYMKQEGTRVAQDSRKAND